MSKPSELKCFNLPWQDFPFAQGVRLRVCGEGKKVILIPGMEGSGESCADLAEWLVSESRKNGNPVQIVLVDYRSEREETLEHLTHAIAAAIESRAVGRAILWSQSFGNVIATKLLATGRIQVSKHLMFSPFASLPRWKQKSGEWILRWSPRVLYRWLSPLVSRLLFGPIPSPHPFLEVLANEDPVHYAKRVGWLRDPSLKRLFSDISCSKAIWIGDRDRLIEPARQIQFYENLKRSGSVQLEVKVLPGIGHMLFPELLGPSSCTSLLEWILYSAE